MRATGTRLLRHTGRLRPKSTTSQDYSLSDIQRRSYVSGSEDVLRHEFSTGLLANSSTPRNYGEGEEPDVNAYSSREDLGNEDGFLHIPLPNFPCVYTPPNGAASRHSFGSDRDSPSRDGLENPQTHHLVPRPSTAANSGTTPTTTTYRPPRILPWVVVIIPLLVVPIIIGIIICVYRVPFQSDLFSPRRPAFSYILVDLEDTRIMFVASALGFISPLIGNYIMGIYAPQVVNRFKEDVGNGFSPNLYEFSLIGGICQASLWQFIKTPRYWVKSSGPNTQALKMAYKAYSKFIMFWLLTYGAIGVLHLTTEMVEHDRLDFAVQYTPGRGLRPRCLTYDRLQDNGHQYGLPCTKDYSTPDQARQLREDFRLQRDTSRKSRIHFVQNVTGYRNLGLLLARDVSSEVDYRTSTFGVCSNCSFITDQCGMHDASTNLDIEASLWTIFNCSNGFYGVLGKAPVVVDLRTATDHDIPYLGFKPSLRLQFGYFFDPGLEYPYNPVGYDTAQYTTLAAYPDAELINPVYLGVAGRIDYTGLGYEFPGNQDVWSGQNMYLEFAMRCKIATFEATYSYINGSVSNVELAETNGTIFELFHGGQFYDSFTSNGGDFVEMLNQAGLQNSTSFLAQKWETLFSTKVLSVIGSVTEERLAIMQQERHQTLVARIWWPALAFLFLCLLCYLAAGVSVILSTCRLSLGERLLGEVLSTAGVSFTATSAPSLMQQALKRPRLNALREMHGQVTMVDFEHTSKLGILVDHG